MEIAEILGFKHPKDTKTKVNAVVTLDFLISFKIRLVKLKQSVDQLSLLRY